MGDPPRLRNKYERPKMLWDADRLTHDSTMKTEYGLKCMRELWMMDSALRRSRREARRILSLSEADRKADGQKVLSKLVRIGLLKEGAAIDDVLGLKVKDLLERRLQTLVVRKGLARTMQQSRQLITHGFITLEGRRVQTPGYVVTVSEEPTLGYARPIDISVKSAEPNEAAPEATQASAKKAEAARPAAEGSRSEPVASSGPAVPPAPPAPESS
jgi:small subunit ribosomal protein S4